MRRCRGFTLVELLTVMAVSALMMYILIPVLHSTLSSGRQAKCASNLRQIHLGFHLYAMDHHGIIAPAFGQDSDTENWNADEYYLWPTAIMPYLESKAGGAAAYGELPQGVFRCPESDLVVQAGANTHYGMNAQINSSRSGYETAGKPLYTFAMLTEPAKTVLLADSYHPEKPTECVLLIQPNSEGARWTGFRHNGKANLVFMDGHVETWAPEDFPTGGNAYTLSPWAAQP
ncbi:DUF1559 domain-containing protein [Coraliomargarita algicola]|uniref:DUF1559 domain-containing protein n=1 Tax=Coraliomargarita algicola TaxID=3092156 RepID=A0ABZ0RP80_9BACT|nr:DUF1559 domain-containing protein [Coraliomargarita sp. J2-16]WPJ96923.1 DUF1559 domain-containing protein [Coraliomargarita sp. J2-16]